MKVGFGSNTAVTAKVILPPFGVESRLAGVAAYDARFFIHSDAVLNDSLTNCPQYPLSPERDHAILLSVHDG